MAEAATEQGQQLPADRQADAQAAVFAGQGAVQLLKVLIQLVITGRLEAHPAITHADLQLHLLLAAGAAVQVQADVPAGGELDGVVQQVTEALTELASIALHGVGQAWVQRQDKIQTLLCGPRGEALTQARQQPLQAERRALGLQLAGLQLGEHKDVVDHLQHVPRRHRRNALVLGLLRLQRQGVHQLQGTDHAIHRGAQFMGDGGEEFVLEAVTGGQLVIQGAELGAGVLKDLLALLLHHVDPIRQGQGQQRHLHGRADLAGMQGDKHARQNTHGHQGVHQGTEQKGTPGQEEITRLAQAAPPGHDPGREAQHGEQQRQVGRQMQWQGVTDAQGQADHDQPADHQQLQRPVHPAAEIGGVQEGAHELCTEGGRGSE